MCGIFGGMFSEADEALLNKRLALLHHRGPDQQYMYFSPTPSGTIALGQTRLNIVDHNDIVLPVQLNDHIILFNGEIYNYLSIKKELESLGWSFTTFTDTEVVLAAYIQWKEKCLDLFNGMWAFAIWDGTGLFLSRDRLGKKPLYYRHSDENFEFSSEIKVFDRLKYIGSEQIDLFEFCFDHGTPFEDIFSVKPGHYIYFDPRKTRVFSRQYWSLDDGTDHKIEDPQIAVDGFIELLRDSIELRIRADVPVSMFLSGGIDSALIASLSGLKQSFTCQFKEFQKDINEEYYARDLAQRLDIHLDVITPTREEFFSVLSDLALHLEIPTGSFSVFPLYALSRHAAKAGFKVILTGEGSDELFTGYVRNELLLSDITDYDTEKKRQYHSMYDRYSGDNLDKFCRMSSRTGLQGAAQLKMYLNRYWNNNCGFAKNISRLETTIFLQPLLQMSDRMLMANSIEGRCPFLDYRLVEFSRSINDDLLFRDGTGKWLVHEAAKKVLPSGSLVLKRSVKHGLPTPVNQWLYGQHSFDRTYWNTMMMTECVKQLCID